MYIACGSIDILMILILPIQEHGMLFHLLRFCSTTFSNSLWFSSNRSPTLLVRFIPKYFILLSAILNGILLVRSSSILVLFAYTMAVDFRSLILYPATLPNSRISSSSFCIESPGFSMYRIMSSAYSESLTSSFPIRMPLNGQTFHKGTSPNGKQTYENMFQLPGNKGNPN